jgi:hypothetical protein
METKTYAEYEGAITKHDIWLVTFIAGIVIVVALIMIATCPPRCCRVVHLDIPFVAAPRATAVIVSPIVNAHRHYIAPVNAAAAALVPDGGERETRSTRSQYCS